VPGGRRPQAGTGSALRAVRPPTFTSRRGTRSASRRSMYRRGRQCKRSSRPPRLWAIPPGLSMLRVSRQRRPRRPRSSKSICTAGLSCWKSLAVSLRSGGALFTDDRYSFAAPPASNALVRRCALRGRARPNLLDARARTIRRRAIGALVNELRASAPPSQGSVALLNPADAPAPAVPDALAPHVAFRSKIDRLVIGVRPVVARRRQGGAE
jgi:hypothetical protein